MNNIDKKLDSIIARDLMVEDVVTTEPHEPLAKALALMDKTKRYEIPVMVKGKVTGLISYAVLAKRRNFPLSMHVGKVMFPAPTISPDMSISSVSEVLITEDFRSVPVIENEKLVGIVTRRNIIKTVLAEKIYSSIPVTDIMSTPVTMVEETDDISKALHEMNHLQERSLPVVGSSGKLSGIITLDNLGKYITGKRERASQGELGGKRISPKIDVRSVMITSPVSVPLDSTLGEVMKAIVEKRISTVIVVTDGIPEGIISSLDIIEMVASSKSREEVLIQISGFEPDDPYVYDSIYSVVQRYLPKLSNHVLPRMINFHITHHHHLDSMKKYTVNSRMSTSKKIFITEKNDWDLLKAIDEVMASLLKQVKKYKDRARKHQRGN